MSRNVFVLSVDSLQQSYFAEALSELATQIDAVEFTNAIATSVQTNSAMPGLAASVYDDTLTTQGPPKSGGPTLLAEVLAEDGYDTGLWTDNLLFGAQYNYDRGFSAGNLGRPTLKKRLSIAIKDSPLKPAFGLFEWAYFNVVQRMNDTASGDGTFYRTAAELHSGALDWLENTTDGPDFCWIHYMDAHHPFEPPAEYLAEESLNTARSRSEVGKLSRDVVRANGEGFSRDEIADVAAAYRACCAYLQDELSRFINELLDRGHFDPAVDVLVVTADHGECLNPDKEGVIGHLPTAFWEEIVRVPLLISHPEWDGATVDGQVSLIDVMPTILDAVDLPVPESAEGKARKTPEEMVAESVLAVSQPPTGTTTYRALRHASGWKLFGMDAKPENKIVLSRYETDDPAKEKVVYSTTNEDRPTDPTAVEQWDSLMDQLRVRGPPIEENARVFSNVSKGHLRDLGYID